MPSDSGTALRPARQLSLRAVFAGLGAAALIAVVAVAVQRETRNAAPAGVGIPMTERTAERPPMSAAEEAFATDLWAIHSLVRQDAVRMTFTGLAYKMGDIDARELKARIEPLTKSFDDHARQVGKLVPPASLVAEHQRYQSAAQRYGEAARAMLQAGGTKMDEELLGAQTLSMQSSEDLLRVSDVLWPGEHKPN